MGPDYRFESNLRQSQPQQQRRKTNFMRQDPVMTLVNQLHQRSASAYKNKNKTNQTSEYAGGFGISPSIDDNRFTALSSS